MTAICVKVSKTGKTMLVGHKSNKYQIGYKFAWAANPDGLKPSEDDANPTVVKDFHPVGLEPVFNEDGEPVLHEDGSAVQRWVF